MKSNEKKPHSAFVVETIRRWWYSMGQAAYPNSVFSGHFLEAQCKINHRFQPELQAFCILSGPKNLE